VFLLWAWAEDREAGLRGAELCLKLEFVELVDADVLADPHVEPLDCRVLSVTSAIVFRLLFGCQDLPTLNGRGEAAAV
jgi:hypothetical protein